MKRSALWFLYGAAAGFGLHLGLVALSLLDTSGNTMWQDWVNHVDSPNLYKPIEHIADRYGVDWNDFTQAAFCSAVYGLIAGLFTLATMGMLRVTQWINQRSLRGAPPVTRRFSCGAEIGFGLHLGILSLLYLNHACLDNGDDLSFRWSIIFLDVPLFRAFPWSWYLDLSEAWLLLVSTLCGGLLYGLVAGLFALGLQRLMDRAKSS